MKTAQKAIQSRLNANSTAAKVAAGYDLTGKTALVTGGNSGIGYETVVTLAYAGAQVVVGARDASKANKLSDLTNVSFIPLDLADPVSVVQFAAQFLAEHKSLHLLFNNAGLFRPPQLLKDKRGFIIRSPCCWKVKPSSLLPTGVFRLKRARSFSAIP